MLYMDEIPIVLMNKFYEGRGGRGGWEEGEWGEYIALQKKTTHTENASTGIHCGKTQKSYWYTLGEITLIG